MFSLTDAPFQSSHKVSRTGPVKYSKCRAFFRDFGSRKTPIPSGSAVISHQTGREKEREIKLIALAFCCLRGWRAMRQVALAEVLQEPLRGLLHQTQDVLETVGPAVVGVGDLPL